MNDAPRTGQDVRGAPLGAAEEAAAGPRRPLLRIDGLTRDYGGGRGIFDASLVLAAGEIVGLIGANGSGKTTLLRCATFFEPFDAGSVCIAGHNCAPSANGRFDPVARRRMEEIRGKVVGAVFQNSQPWPHLNVLRNVLLPLTESLHLARDAADERAAQTLELLGLQDRLEAMPWQLSGGLRQRLVLARTLALEPSVIFIDEGTSALDPDWTERVRRILRDYVGRGGAIAVISHQMGFVRRLADTVLFLHRGRILESGTPDEIFEKRSTPELTEFLANA